MKKFAYKFPVIFSVLVFAVCMPLLWGATYPLLYKLPFYWASAIKYSLTLLAVIIICFCVYRRIPFIVKCKKLFKGLFTFGAVGLICAVMAFVFSYAEPDTTPSVSTVFGFIFYNLAIAVSEEFLFRGVIFTQMLDSWEGGFYGRRKIVPEGERSDNANKTGFIWAAIIVSSVIFGLRHLLNLVTAPNVVITTIGQVFFTFMAGFYLCAVYLRTRNIWVCVVIHFFEDFFTGFWAIVSTSAAVAQTVDGTVLNMFMLVAVHSVYVIFGVIMLKCKKSKWKYMPLYECAQSVAESVNNNNEI